jgi:hypothetical protein
MISQKQLFSLEISVNSSDLKCKIFICRFSDSNDHFFLECDLMHSNNNENQRFFLS